ncbi:MAG: CARDB domain-containing protein [Candidatus Altarchaeum sp.]|nr:CARDB domain-containing protein [Candidatus Altarchaeum sp.]
MKKILWGFGFIFLAIFCGVCSTGEIIKVKILEYDSDSQIYTNNTVNLSYDPGSNSYHDAAAVNPNVYLAAYATEQSDLEGKWIGLAYKAGDKYRMVLADPTQGVYLLSLSSLSKNGTVYYSQTDQQIQILSDRGQYPGIMYAVITDGRYSLFNIPPPLENSPSPEQIIPNNAIWIRLDPETDGWLIGHDYYNDGSWTCHHSENFTYEDLAHGSYRMNISTSPGNVNVTVRAAYCDAYYDYDNEECKNENIRVDTGFIVIGIKKIQNFLNETLLNADKDMINDFLGSKITSISANYTGSGIDRDNNDGDDTVNFIIYSYSGTACIYVNGIREWCGNVTGIGPDLTVSNISVNNTNPVIDETVKICANISNIGNTTANNSNGVINVSFYVNEIYNNSVNIFALNAGNITEVCFNYTITYSGNFTFNITADPNNEIPELNEMNNQNTMNVNVYCTPNMINTTWSNWYNITACNESNQQIQQRNSIQYDNNSCGEIANTTYYENQTVTCDFCTPSINISKTANLINVVNGTNVTYTYFVNNTGNVPLTIINITDDKLGLICTPNVVLTQGQTTNCTKQANLTQVGIITNVGNVTANYSDQIVSATANATVNVTNITQCTSDTNCSGNNFCNLSIYLCQPKKSLDEPCTGSNQCLSGNCFKNVCKSTNYNCNSNTDCVGSQLCNTTTHTCYTSSGGPSGGGCTTCVPQPYGGIPVGQVITTYQISATIPDATAPGSYCFKTTCTTNTYQNGKLTKSSTKNVSVATNIILTLPDGSNITVHTNANGEICYDFGCGIYTITIPKGVCGEAYTKTITTSYGKLHITSSDLTKAKVNEVLTYIIKDDSGNAIKIAKVNIRLPDRNLVKTSDYAGKVSFNVGEKEGSYTIIAQKDCYENETLTGTIVMPKLTVTCDSQVNINGTLCCYVKDQDGNDIKGANVKLTMPGSVEISLISDVNGKICTDKTEIAGDVTAIASKEEYKDSNIAASKITKAKIICLKECKCGCIEGTTLCKKCPECNIFGLPCWIWVLIVLLIALLLLLLLKKKKIYADDDAINKARYEEKIEIIAEKYKEIYVSRKEYEKIQRMNIEDKIKAKFKFVDLNKKGENYLQECEDKDISMAKQLNAELLTSNDERAKKAEENKVKVIRYK